MQRAPPGFTPDAQPAGSYRRRQCPPKRPLEQVAGVWRVAGAARNVRHVSGRPTDAASDFQTLQGLVPHALPGLSRGTS
ncbi:hypothetical protein KPATCC21470_6358 [Kitasatospora purpeofusca]